MSEEQELRRNQRFQVTRVDLSGESVEIEGASAGLTCVYCGDGEPDDSAWIQCGGCERVFHKNCIGGPSCISCQRVKSKLSAQGLGRFLVWRRKSALWAILEMLLVASWIVVLSITPRKPRNWDGPFNAAERYARLPAFPFKLAQGLSVLMAGWIGLSNLIQAWTLANAGRCGRLRAGEEGLVALEGVPDCGEERLETANGAPCLFLREREQHWKEGGKNAGWHDRRVMEFALPFKLEGVRVLGPPSEIYGERSFADADRPAATRTLTEYLPLSPRITVMGRLRLAQGEPRVEMDPVFGMILSLRGLRRTLFQEFSKAVAGLSVAGFFLYFLLR